MALVITAQGQIPGRRGARFQALCRRGSPSSAPGALRHGRRRRLGRSVTILRSDLPPPRRALTGRDEAGKSVFKSFNVTPVVVEIDANPGLTFYELYMTEDVPQLSGMKPDPMLKGTIAFPGPGGTMSYPTKRPEGWKPPPGVTFESGLKELSEKVPGMGDHFDRTARGMHTSDTIDYGIVVRGEMTLELDDGQKIPLRQGDCVVQNGTRHR